MGHEWKQKKRKKKKLFLLSKECARKRKQLCETRWRLGWRLRYFHGFYFPFVCWCCYCCRICVSLSPTLFNATFIGSCTFIDPRSLTSHLMDLGARLVALDSVWHNDDDVGHDLKWHKWWKILNRGSKKFTGAWLRPQSMWKRVDSENTLRLTSSTWKQVFVIGYTKLIGWRHFPRAQDWMKERSTLLHFNGNQRTEGLQ